MSEYPLRFLSGHFFVELDDALWLLDTGAPSSFGAGGSVRLCDRSFDLDDGFMGLTTESLAELTGVDTAGLLGADVLNKFDHEFDHAAKRISISRDEIPLSGSSVPHESFMGIPVVSVEIDGETYSMFFDTGAQISYFQDSSLERFPEAGLVTDFYPGAGQFQTETHLVNFQLGDLSLNARFGRLPELLSATLLMAGTQGIVGNEILLDRVVVFCPRRKRIMFQ